MAAMPSCPPIAGDICRQQWLSQARRLVPGLPLPQARHSREITPPERLWLNARRPASDSMPAGSPLTQARRIAAVSCPPDCRWLKPTGLALTHARWPPLSLAPWIESTRHGQECRVSVLLCPQEHFKSSCHVLSMETRLGQAAPCLVAMEAILAACPPVVDMEAVTEGPFEGLWLLVMPKGSLSLQASPGGLLVPVGCPVLSVWPWRAFLLCFVLSCCVFSPGGLLIPPNFPKEILGGV